MFPFKKKASKKQPQQTSKNPINAADFAIYTTVSGNQRSSFGERGEMCTGTMNNNQKLATLQMMRSWRD